MGVTVHVRRIAPDDAERLRGVRLAALANAPGSFWQTLADESARPPEDWRARALRNSAGDGHATFLLERDDDPMGMVDVYQPSRAPEFRELAAMWVAPAVRGTGAADVLLDAAVGWSLTVGAIGVRLWVVPTNTAAVRIYTRHGFTLIGDPEPDTDDPAGKVYVPMLLALDEQAAASPTYMARARAPWTDESG
jgi:GNAT superfamily N-acetyltransferase